jgi:hypothetical protein
MSYNSFYGAPPRLLGQHILYRESRSQGRYDFDLPVLEKVIDEVKKTDDSSGLEQIVRELFSVCNQGRRPWSLNAERSFLVLARLGHDALCDLRLMTKVGDSTYASIDPLRAASRLASEAAHIDATDQEGRWDAEVGIFDQLIHVYIAVYSNWTSDHPETAGVPHRDGIEQLLEGTSDMDFEIMLGALARTKNPVVEQVLESFTRDDEDAVRQVAKRLLAHHF